MQENIIKISTKDNIGIEDLKNKIKELFLGDKINNLDSTIIVNQRHKFLLDEAYEMLMEAKNEIDINMPIDMVSITLKKAAKCLGEIVGLDVSVDVAQKVFEKFCIGK